MIRDIKFSDKDAVMQISSQLWEGDDYVGNVFDEWIIDDDGLFVGYWEDKKLIGFGRMRFLTPTDIWLEALRKDPQTDVKGVGYKIAKYFFEQLKGKKIDSIRFSTYFGNIASIKLNEKLGFNMILTLSLKELDISKDQIKSINNSITKGVNFKVLDQYILDSSYLKATKYFISKGWVLHQYTSKLLEEFHSEKQCAVYLESREIKGAILISEADYNNVFWISFIEADNENVFNELIYYAEKKSLENLSNKIQLLVPDIIELNKFVDNSGFKSWEQNNDFFLYELPKKMIKQITGV